MGNGHGRMIFILGCMFGAQFLVPRPAGAGDPTGPIDRIRADVKYLSSDRLEGRGIGSAGEELAIEYIAKEFQKSGLKPAGERGTYFQTVPLLAVTTEPSATLTAKKGEQTIALQPEVDFAGTSQTQQPVEKFDAEMVFVGHGIVAPEFGWNDYQGVDVKDKIVLLFTNEPPSDDPGFFKGKALTYYGRWTFKFEEAARRGAKAVFIIHTNETAGYPYSVVQTLAAAQIEKAPEASALAFAGWLSRQAGEKVLNLAGKSVEVALKEANTRGFKPTTLGIQLQGRMPTKMRRIATKNVIGRVEGSDPLLTSETVIFTAHWDHLGVGKAVLGDNIYNGAADNATGCAILLELARLWAAQQPRPKRSAIFLATTAEESGLLGAEHYARHPVVPLGKTAINLNFDMILPLGVPESIVVNGAERTTAWPIVQAAAQKRNLAIEPDKQPGQGFYYRSDHFVLARGGVPAFKVDLGTKFQGKPVEFAKHTFETFNAQKYHTPADEYQEDWDFSGFPVLIHFALDVAREVANLEKLPTWMESDEFLPARTRSGVK
jgi:Zn-dependent M28 family amino/carboxypeptidase